MEQRRILVTGGAGNVGGALVRRLVMQPENFVVIVDDLSTGERWKLPPTSYGNWTFIKADVNQVHDVASIMTSYRFDYVFHYAAVVGVQRTLENPLCVLQDIEGFKNVLMLSKNTGVQRVFFSSSSEVYGEPVEFPQNEQTTPLNSRLPYAIVKNVGEAYFRSFHQEHGLEYTIFRFFNTYGPLQSDQFVISKFIQQALKNQPLTVYGDGSQTRTFCYVDDNIATTLAILNSRACPNDVVNIGSDIEISMLDLANCVKHVLNSDSKIVHLPALKEGDMTRRCPDISKMRSLLKADLCPLELGLERTAKFLAERMTK